MTKKEMFAEIRKVVADNAEMVAFIDHEIELLNRKSGSPRKPTKTQVENDGFKADILAALAEADAPVTIKELCEVCGSIADLSNQRVSALVRQMVGVTIDRTEDKRKAYFSKIAE